MEIQLNKRHVHRDHQGFFCTPLFLNTTDSGTELITYHVPSFDKYYTVKRSKFDLMFRPL